MRVYFETVNLVIRGSVDRIVIETQNESDESLLPQIFPSLIEWLKEKEVIS